MTSAERPSPEKTLLCALHGERAATPPIWLMRQAGRYLPEYRALRAKATDFLTFCLTPALAAEATLQPVQRFGLDGAILFSDILVVPHALGQKLAFREGEGPVLDPVADRAGLKQLRFEAARLDPIGETVRRVRRALPQSTGLIGFAGAPWTVATYMIEGGTSRDFLAARRWSFGDPEGFSALIDRLVEATIAYLGLQIDAGAEAIQLFDSWAGVLPEAAFRRWVIEPTGRIATALKSRHPDIPIIGFPRGAGLLYEAYAEASGVDALSLDATVPLGWARERLQPRLPLQGNLDPILLAIGGPAMAEAARGIAATLAAGPFVFNLGHGVLPETPPEHVAALVAAVRGTRPAR